MKKNSENDIEEATSEPGVNHEEAMFDEEKQFNGDKKMLIELNVTNAEMEVKTGDVKNADVQVIRP